MRRIAPLACLRGARLAELSVKSMLGQVLRVSCSRARSNAVRLGDSRAHRRLAPTIRWLRVLLAVYRALLVLPATNNQQSEI